MPITNDDSSSKIKCPVCGQQIDLVEHPQFKNFLVAYHDCRPGLGMTSVYETDNPAYKTPKEKVDEVKK